MDKELVDLQKECFKAIEAYGKLTFGYGYAKILQKRLNLINKRVEMVISDNERRELEEQKHKIENKIKIIKTM